MAEDSALTKTIILCALASFIALASLTASLPINLPSHQQSLSVASESASYPAGGSDSGDTAWMIVATIFGFFLGPAIAYLYGFLHGLHSDLIKTIIVMSALISTVWIIFSFSLAYGEDANGDQIMGFPKTYYMFRSTGSNSAADNNAPTIPNSIFAVFELGFALVAPTIVAASVAGRVNINAFLVFIFIWHLVIYTPIAHIVWFPTGWFQAHIIEDFAGGLVVHQLAAITAIALHIVLGRDGIAKTKPVASSEVARIVPAALAVWFLWFGFNAGKAHGANPVAAQSIVNTIAATTSAILISYFYDLFFEVATTPVSMAVAVVIALVGITPASGYVTVGGAMCISIFTVLVTRLVGHHVIGEGNTINEPLSILTIHGVAGTAGFFATAVFSYKFINDNAFNGLTYGRGIPLSHHIAAILALWSCAFLAIWLLAVIVNAIVPLAVQTEGAAAEYKAPSSATPASPATTEVEKTKEVDNVEPSGVELSAV